MSRWILLLLLPLLAGCGARVASADTVYQDTVAALTANDRAQLTALVANPLSDHLDLVLERVQAQVQQPTFETVEVQPLASSGAGRVGLTIWRSQGSAPRCWRAALAQLGEGWRVVAFDLTDRQCPAQ